jgi:carbonic anhydrase
MFNATIGKLYASDLSGNIYGYNFQEMRVHAPSEHTIEGSSFAVELQLFFNIREEFPGVTNKRAAISLLFKENTDKKVAIDILTMMTAAEDKRVNHTVAAYLKSVMPAPFSYFVYEGSETLPGCTEDVIWYIGEKPIPISSDQIDVFNKLWSANKEFGVGNNRQLNTLGTRTIKKGGIECEEQFIYFFSFVLLYAFINYFIFKLL